MTQHYLSLVLVEVPDHLDETPYKHWFRCVAIDSLRVKNGLLEVVFFDGTIKVFNSDETDDILFDTPEYLHEYLNSQSS